MATDVIQSSLTDRVNALRSRCKYVRIETRAERFAVYRLRHDCYLNEGAIARRQDGLLTDEFDTFDNTTTFGLLVDGRLAASIRIHVLDAAVGWASPTSATFGDVLSPMIADGQRLIDPTRFVVDREMSRRAPELAYLALRLPIMAAVYFDANKVLAAVRMEHMPFYRRVLRCSAHCGPRPYLQLTKPLGLMITSYPEELPSIIKRYPFFAADSGEGDQLFSPDKKGSGVKGWISLIPSPEAFASHELLDRMFA